MTHAGKLLARLNPSNVRFDVGRGGLPELTPQDIAGALGMVPAGLGRELLCVKWWPDGAALTAGELDKMLECAQFGEWRSRMERLVDAQLADAMARTRDDRRRASSMLDAARSSMWPGIGPDSRYQAIRKSVLHEMSAAHTCATCKGRMSVQDCERVITCPACDGTGHWRASDRSRALSIGRDVSTYCARWRDVYEWTLRHCIDAIGPAEARFVARVGETLNAEE